MKKVIKIAVDGGDFIPGDYVKSGIQRILDSFLKQVKNRKYKSYNINYYHFGKRGLPRKLFSTVHLPRKILRDKNDLFLGFSGNIPQLLKLSKIKKILFLYDLGFFKFPKLYSNPDRLKKNTFRSIRLADKIVVLSQYSRKQLVKYFGSLVRDKIEVICPGLNHFKRIKKTKSQLGKYFLYVGVIKPMKNIEEVLKYASKFRDHRLILIGRGEKDYLKRLKLHNGIIHLHNISDKELINYIVNADAVLNFSREEGFCFPIGETLYLRKKVIVKELPVYKELKENLKKNIYRWDIFTLELIKLIKKLVQ